MKFKNTLPQLLAILFLIIGLASCQEDFSNLGSDVIGGQGINLLSKTNNTVVAYSKKLEAVQSNNLTVYQLGTYSDPVYGKSKHDLVSQLVLGTADPDFGYETVLDSVILYIPYFSEATTTDEVTTYTLDSVYGSSPINLKIYESNYYLRDYDPATGLQDRQKYYSNLGDVFESGSNIGELLYEEESLLPSDEGYVLLSPDTEDDEDEDPDETLVAPGVRVSLPVSFFTEKIIDQEGNAVLANNNNFKDYFRGLYFKTDDLGTGGNLFLFNIANASVKLYYTYQSEDPATTTTGDEIDRLDGELTLTFTGNNVNLFDNALTPSIASELEAGNTDMVNGEESLYVQGGNGIAAVIDLFGTEDADGNGISDEIDEMREEQWLINEANLIFYVDQDKITGGAAEPDRLFLYDVKNESVLVDYGQDFSVYEEAFDAITSHLGTLQRGSDENGEYYKMRITHHVNNIVLHDSTNVPLALVVTQNVLTVGFQDVETPIELGTDTKLKSVPASSVISHQGTVLFGNTAANEEKRLKLQIYYTKPN